VNKKNKNEVNIAIPENPIKSKQKSKHEWLFSGRVFVLKI